MGAKKAPLCHLIMQPRILITSMHMAFAHKLHVLATVLVIKLLLTSFNNHTRVKL